MRIWITGIAGFLGSHLAEQLLKEGHDVYGNDSLICGDQDNIPSRVYDKNRLAYMNGGIVKKAIDCCDYPAMLAALNEFKPEVVIHAAATAHEGFSPYSPHFICRNIYEASVSTFSAAISAGVKRIVFMSTMARYGKQEPPFTEETPAKPVDPYGIAKVAAEDTLRELCKLHDVKYSIMVPHNIIGTRQKYDDPYRNVVSIFMNRMLQGKSAVIYGDGGQTRCFSPIQDVMPSIIKAVHGEADGEIVNIGPDSTTNLMTINELAERIGNFTGHNGKPDYYPERGCDAYHAHCSSDKARKLLGFEATHSVDDCFKEMIEDIKTKGTKPFDYFMPIEIPSEKCPRTWKERLL